MSKKKIDPDAMYKIRLKRPIEIGRSVLRPRDGLRLKGVHLEANLDAVESYELI